MERLKRAAILTRLVQKLREKGSWCGETHVQKATNFLQDLLQVPTDFAFILYKHGPFSFDLRDELTSLRADEMLELEPQAPPYGPRIVATERADYIQGLFPQTLASYENRINFVADRLARKDVSELERLATALYVNCRAPQGASIAERAEKLVHIKRHVSPTNAETAVKEVDQMFEEAEGLVS